MRIGLITMIPEHTEIVTELFGNCNKKKWTISVNQVHEIIKKGYIFREEPEKTIM